MSFFTSAIDTLQILVVALGAGLGAWGVINLWKDMEMTIPELMLMYGKVAL